MLINEGVQVVWAHAHIVHQYMVMSRAGSPLDSGMRIEVEVVLERMGDVSFYQDTWDRIAIPIGSRLPQWEEPDMMTL